MSLTFNWTTVAVSVLNILVGGVLVSLIKSRPALQKIANDREANLLHERAEEMASMRDRLEAVEKSLHMKEKHMEAERTIYRHRIANLGQAFTALLMLLKKGVPVDEAVAEVDRLRSEQLDREIAEAAMFRAAGLKIDIADPEKPDNDTQPMIREGKK